MATDSAQTNELTGEMRFFMAPEEVTGSSYAGCNSCGSTGWVVSGAHYAGIQEEDGANEYLRDEFCDAGWIPQGDPYFSACKYTEATACNLMEW